LKATFFLIELSSPSVKLIKIGVFAIGFIIARNPNNTDKLFVINSFTFVVTQLYFLMSCSFPIIPVEC